MCKNCGISMGSAADPKIGVRATGFSRCVLSVDVQFSSLTRLGSPILSPTQAAH